MIANICTRCNTVYTLHPGDIDLGLCDDCEAADAQAFEDWLYELDFGPWGDDYQYSVWRGWQWRLGDE